MTCRLCHRPIICDCCDGDGEIVIQDIDFIKHTVDCPVCDNLHGKCFEILNDMMHRWRVERDQKDKQRWIRIRQNGL